MKPSLFESLSDYDAQELKGGNLIPDETLNPSEFFFKDNQLGSVNEQGFNFGTYVKNTNPEDRSKFNPAVAYGLGIGSGTNYGLQNKAQTPG